MVWFRRYAFPKPFLRPPAATIRGISSPLEGAPGKGSRGAADPVTVRNAVLGVRTLAARQGLNFPPACAPRGDEGMIVGLLAIVGAVAVGKALYDWSRQGDAGRADRAHGLYVQGRYAEAAGAYNEAIGEGSRDAHLYSRRGHALQKLGRHDAALRDYRRAAELDPDNPAAYCDAAGALMALNRPKDALDMAKRAVLRSRKSARAHRIKGEALWAMDMVNPALDALRASSDLHDTAGVRVRIAEAQCARNNHDDERRELDQAIAMKPGSADLHYRRARALLHVAKSSPKLREASCRQAITDLEMALEIDARHEEAAEMLRRASGMLGEAGEGAG